MISNSKKLYFILTIILFFSLLIFINITRAEGIIFSEIMYDPMGSDSGNEWIELFNKTTSSVFIGSDWRLGDTSNHLINFYNGPTNILPGSFFVIAQNASNFLNNYPNYASLHRPLYESSFSLNNASGTIKLFQGPSIITEQGYTSVIGGNGNGKTLERVTPQFNDNVWTEGWLVGGTPGSLSNTAPILYAPVAMINISTTTIHTGESILFDASSSTDQNGDVLNYVWNIGDIVSSTDPIFTHCFLSSGTYNVSLTVSDATSSNTASVIINVLENIEIPPVDYTGKIILNELLPNPEGDDDGEWIELKNISSDDIDLTDFLIQDESGRGYLISLDDFSTTTIGAGEFFAIDYLISRIVLNNTGDKITIFDSNENKISEISYSSVKEGQSFARFNNAWSWTNSPTKGLENVLTENTQNSNSVTIINNTTNNTSDIVKEENALICDSNSLNKSIIISEVFPNPGGDDINEFIEIYNPNDYDINITNWKIKDLSKSSYSLSGAIGSKNYLLISREDSKIALNNSNEEIFIYDCGESSITSLKYDKSYENKSYSYNLATKEYFWTASTTPGEENIFENKEGVVNQERFASTSLEVFNEDETEIAQEYLDISFNELSKNEVVSGHGAVVFVQNQILSNSAYICNYKLEEKVVDYYDCINLYFNGKWPALKRGSILKFNGKFSESTSSKKIKVSKKENIEVVDSVKLLNPDEILISNIDEGLLGSFISIRGQISKLNKKSFNIKSDEDEFKIKVVTNDIDLKKFTKEENVFISGVVIKEKDSFVLALGNKSDFIKDQQAEESAGVLGEKIKNQEMISLADNKKSFLIKVVSNIGKFFQSIKSGFINKILASK